MSSFEKSMNDLTDKDWGWQPFLFLKPSKKTLMTNSFLLKISMFYMTPVAIIYTFYGIKVGLNIMNFLLIEVICVAFFFLGYKYTFAIFWNRRAKRLNTK